MASIINEELFKSLQKDSEIHDANDDIWTVLVVNCGGPGNYTTHLFRRNRKNKDEYMFHDGTYMRFFDSKDKERDGSICGDFEDLALS